MAPSPDNSSVPTRGVVRAATARWRLGSEDYLATLDQIQPPPAIVSGDPAQVSVFDNSRELGNIVELALLRTKEVLELPMDPDGDPEDTNARSRVVLAASRIALQTQLRADANVLKRTSHTAHTAMLRDLKALKGRIDARTIEHVAVD